MTTPEILTLQEAADRLGVHYMTAYRYVRLGMLKAQQRGRSWEVLSTDLDEYMAKPEERTPRGGADWAGRFSNRIIEADHAGAWQVIEAALSSGMATPDAYREIIVPAMRSVGDAWESGDIDVATEHAASEVTRRVIGRLGPKMRRRGVRRGTVVLGSTATEMHSLPLAIAADIFRSAQFDVVDLGVYLPPDSFAAFVEKTDDLVAVGIGVTIPNQDKELENTVSALRSATSAPIILGGAGASQALADRLGTLGWAETADQAVAIAEAVAMGSVAT